MSAARLIVLVAAIGATCAQAQSSREAMRQSYLNWRQADQNLERDAGRNAADAGARADKVAAEAAKYTAAKKAYFESRAAELAKQAEALPEFVAPSATDDDTNKKINAFIGLEMSAVNAGIDAFGNDPDKGIQQLRQMMERERTALNNLTSGLKDSQAAAANATRAAEQVQQQRMAVTEHIRTLAAAVKRAGEASQSPSLADYYRSLGSGGRSGAGGPATTGVRPGGAPAANPVAAASAAGPGSASPLRSPASVPLSRYTGAWTYLRPNSIFRGMEPEFVDLVVHEERGEITGTLYARFKAPGGTDPVLRFDFSGSLANARNQTFPLLTSDGTKGSIELIPGPAFNLLEVNFGTDPAAGKIRQGNFILVKK